MNREYQGNARAMIAWLAQINPAGVQRALINAGYSISNYTTSDAVDLIMAEADRGVNMVSVLADVETPSVIGDPNSKPFWETTFGQIVAAAGPTVLAILTGGMMGAGSGGGQGHPDNSGDKTMIYIMVGLIAFLFLIIGIVIVLRK